MKKYFTKTICLLLILPPLFMASVIYRYEMSKKNKHSNYFRKEIEYDRPVAKRTPAATNRQEQDALLHEAFSR